MPTTRLGSAQIHKITLPPRLSFSSLSQFAECGEQWRLQRGLKLGSNFAWWANVGGSAVHEITALIDQARIDGQPAPEWDFNQFMLEEEKKYVGVELRASGMVRNDLCFAGGPNKKDRDWWLVYGPKMVEAYEVWVEAIGWEIIGVEVGFEVVIDGEPRIGHIDRVFATPEGQVIIGDVKTGKEQVGRLQLGTYRAGYREFSGIDADWGYFIGFQVPKGGTKVETPLLDDDGQPVMYARGVNKGKPKMTTKTIEGPVQAYLSGATDFNAYSDSYVQGQYATMRRGLENAVFIPNTRACGTCPVYSFCRAVDGDKSHNYPSESIVELVPGASEPVLPTD